MRRFFWILHALTLLTQAVTGLAVAWVVRRFAPGTSGLVLAALCVGTALAGWLPLFPSIALARADRHVSRARVLAGELYYVIWTGGLGAGLVYLPVLGVARVVSGLGALEVAACVVTAGLGTTIWGVLIRPRFVRVRRVEVAVEDLPPALDGYRIAHLSDLHIGAFTPKERGLGWARTVDRLGVDLVALTGDYVTAGEAFHDDIADVLGAFRAKDGVVASMGNHDYFGDGTSLIAKLRTRGVTLLQNEHLVLEREGARLAIVGIDDLWTKRARPEPAMRARPSGVPSVVLAHDPLLFEKLADLGADLVLSGHTHWGQVGVPFLAHRLSMGRIAHRYNGGRYERGKSTLWIHPGLGATGVPIRVGVAPEITVLVLRVANRPSR